MRVQIVFVHRNDDRKIVLQCGIDRLRFEKVVGTVDFGNVRIGEGIVVRLREERGRTERRCKKRGEAFFYKNKAGETIYGSQILANKLEMSNVDLGQSLSEVIVTQKAYE
ncbi:MAG: hypothetical protein ACFNQG_08585, partial [Treponema socranskii subsp. buccale]